MQCLIIVSSLPIAVQQVNSLTCLCPFFIMDRRTSTGNLLDYVKDSNVFWIKAENGEELHNKNDLIKENTNLVIFFSVNDIAFHYICYNIYY